MDLDEYKKNYEDKESTPGWDAIDQALEEIYPNQEPKHVAPVLHYSIGGNDPIDGVSIYRAEYNKKPYFHIVTYGFSELYYNEEAVGGDYSKFGFELTFRIKLCELDDEYPHWAINMIQNIARYVFKSGKWFEPYHYMPAGGQIRLESNTELTGLAFLPDPELGIINTPHGEVQFLQMFGINDKELEKIKTVEKTSEALINQHRNSNPLLITDLCRNS